MAVKFNPIIFSGFDFTSGAGASIGSPVSGGTAKSVLFIDNSGNLGQDNPDFTYDSATNKLNIENIINLITITSKVGTDFDIFGDVAINLRAAQNTINPDDQANLFLTNSFDLNGSNGNITAKDGDLTMSSSTGAAGISGVTSVYLQSDPGNVNLIAPSGHILLAANTYIDANAVKIQNLADPTVAQDAATKNYIDTNFPNVTLTAVGSVANANGASLSGQVLTLQPADGTHPGVLTSGTQTIGGNKTFTGTISASNLSGTNTGDVTLTAVGSTPSANGASLSGQVLTLQPADATHPGLLTILAQTIAGNKTFTGTISASNLSGTNTGDVTLAAVGSSPNANAASLSGQILTIQPADGTNPGVLTAGTQTIGGAKTFSSTTTVANLIDSGLTANTVPYADGSKQLTSSAVTPTELGFLSGVTSSIQVQLNSKGTVSSVALALPISVFTVSGSPVTTTGTLTGTFTNQSANTVFAGPTTGGATTPAFRALVAADIPSISLTTGVSGILPIANGGTNNSSAPTNGQLLIGNGTTYVLSTLTAGNGITVTNGSGTITVAMTVPSSTGDIKETSFTAADNQSSPANVTGFAFANGTVRSFDALVSIVRNTTYAAYKLVGIQKGSSWEMSQEYTGDVTGLVFSITTAGQVQYTSTSTGSTATVKFRAITTSV